MSANQLTGASPDPIALLAQLIDQVAEIRQDIAEIKQDLAEIKRDLAEIKQDLAEIKQDLAVLKVEMHEVKQEVRIFTKTTTTRYDWQSRQDDLERRVAALEEAERRRRTGKGA